MSAAARRRQLRELLNNTPTTGDFVRDVLAALEGLYGDDAAACDREGFQLLERAAEAFEEGEDDDDDPDDDDEADEEDEAG